MQAKLIAGATALGLAAMLPAHATDLVIATVNNGQMIQMQKLTGDFEKANPDIHVKWVTLEENVLRQRVTTDIATKGGQFDVMTIGMYEVPIWAKLGWLKPIQPDASYDEADLLPAIRSGLSYKGTLYAAPFYGESSMLMYRKDLMQKAGLSMPADPTWKQVQGFAAKMNDPKAGVYGICLRGKPGWGENMALLSTMVNTFGGQWFNMQWQPQLQSKPWKDAVSFYVNLLNKYGPPGAASNGFNANLSLFDQGKCAMWVDATVAAGFVSDPKQSKVSSEVGFAQAPVAVTPKGSHWLWSWALAVPADVDAKHEAAAQKFINWATSRAYVKLVASHDGWGLVPSGTRESTYDNPKFQAAAPWAKDELAAIRSADPDSPTLPKSPYVGIQFAAIPEFQAIGTQVGQDISAALTGRISVDKALAEGNAAATREMKMGGYLK
ncbi:MAG: sugar ABC transporter substrate-binding protein [Betaproteobacteria bacterium]|nr:sugar ABC transporter substrate-binding protein [Betaproteobacteria bacterium]MBU6513869.1 sugar ABC transporter substrate-binding protein [Betaproteobacteria bacterium]MDE2151881.1 sugar ABC transporter substrate-binding protein [Betaproteobacteria bacterium]MDE2477904.1 sugar ABC transporter substrate-binding protein [Betaproteobacteria bacterium]